MTVGKRKCKRVQWEICKTKSNVCPGGIIRPFNVSSEDVNWNRIAEGIVFHDLMTQNLPKVNIVVITMDGPVVIVGEDEFLIKDQCPLQTPMDLISKS